MAIATLKPSPFQGSQARSLFRSRLGGALRTALACAAVGATTVYGPASLRRQAAFPAFSYVTAILIAGEATVGDAIHGTVSAVCGTALGALPAALTLFLIRPEHFSVTSASLAVGLSAFTVVLPAGSTSLITKRIALSQIVLIYAAVLRRDAADSGAAAAGQDMKAFMHPVHVAVSTAVGVAASLLAMLLPYPRLAFYEAREEGRIYRGIAAERLRLVANAFFAENRSSFVAFTSQALSLKLPSTKLLQSIKLKQASTRWEVPPMKSLMSWPEPAEKLEETELALQGMEMALASTTTSNYNHFLFINKFLNDIDNSDYLQFKFGVLNLRDHLIIRLLQDYNHHYQNFVHDHDLLLDHHCDHLHLLPPNIMPQSAADLLPFFFLFCLMLLRADRQPMITIKPSIISPDRPAGKIMPTTEQYSSCRDQNPNPSTRLGFMFTKTIHRFLDLVSSERIIVALKCALSVGLAVFFGAVFSRDNAYWSGLAVAVTITPWREATFKLASLRAQGTALGSVYGVLGALIFQNLMELRFLVLLPWIIFTNFLRRSRMLGPSGAVAAAISAIFILGRKNYGSPTAFAITRLVETYIGCACSISVELALQPKRASVLAREKLRQSFAVLIDCVEHSLAPPRSMISSSASREKENLLRQQVNALRKWIGEAETEPNFCFSPFPVASYKKLHFSLAKMVELLSFLIKSLNLLEENQDQEQEHTLERFKTSLCKSLKCIQGIIQVKSLSEIILLQDDHKEKPTIDIEAAAAAAAAGRDDDLIGLCEEECDKIVAALMGKAKEVIERADVESRSKVMLCFGALGFCVDGLMRETREIEKGVLELLQYQNPGKHVDLREISKQIGSKDIRE